MRKLKYFLTCLLIASISMVSAQTKVASGTVVSSEDGQPVIGASVIVKGTSQGVMTDINGKYELSVKSSVKKLTISLVGMKTVEVPALPNQFVKLKTDDTQLDEVMVIGYGTTTKKSFTGAAATVNGEKLSKLQSSNLSKSLEGSVSGLQTTVGSGQPGAGSTMIIRGIGSISAGKSPLIILDGVPYEGSLNSINSQDIETMTVLKDAAANSMYGARGSNGVIIITSKKGEKGKVKIKFEGRTGFNDRGVSFYNVIDNPKDYYEMYWESLRNKNLASMGYLPAGQKATNDLINNGLKYNIFKDIPNTQLVDPLTGKINPNAVNKKWNENWLTDPFEKGLRQEYNVSVSSGTDDGNIYASLSYLDDNGYVVNSSFERISAKIKMEQKLSKNVKVGGSLDYINTKTNNVSAANANYSNIFMFGQSIAPIFPIYLYDQNGNPIKDAQGNHKFDFGTENARPYGAQQNPLAVLKGNKNLYIIDILSSRGFAEFKFLDDFKFTTNLSYDIFLSNTTDFMTPIGGDAASVGGRGQKEYSRYNAMNWNQLLNYNKDIAGHHVNVLLGHEIKHDNSSSMYGHMTKFVDPNNPEFSNATKYQELTSGSSEYSLEGYFGRLEYDYNDKYYFNTSYRVDGSSRFHKDVRWGSFWAVGASWRISKEEFMDGLSFINDAKLKASYGTQGNDDIGTWYAYRDLYKVKRVDGEAAMNLAFRGNPKLTWEKSNNFNTGFELSMWDNRLNVNFDYFIKETKDLLYARPIPVSLGTPDFQWVNDIDMKNNGIELEVGVDVIKTNDFKWNISTNLTHYKNQITRLPSDRPKEGYRAGRYWRKVGGSIYDFYTYEYAGVDPKTGLALYNKYDDDKKKVIKKVNNTGEATEVETGKTSIPDLYGGLGTIVEYKGFDFSAQTAFQIGGYVIDGVYQALMNSGNKGTNFHKDMFKRWTPGNTNTDVPKLLFESRDQNGISDRWLTDASYFSIRNLTLGYTLPKKVVENIKLQNLRVYVVADNVWYTSKRKGLDVRQSFSGTTSYAYSPLRTISLGLSLTL